MRFLGVAMLFLPICYGLVDVGAVVCIGVWLGWLAGCAGRGVRLHLRSFWWFARLSGGGGVAKAPAESRSETKCCAPPKGAPQELPTRGAERAGNSTKTLQIRKRVPQIRLVHRVNETY